MGQPRRERAGRWIGPAGWVGLVGLLSQLSCGAAFEQTGQVPPPAPQTLPAPPQPEGPEPTAALDLDGERRVAEPAPVAGRRAADPELHPLVLPLAERRHPLLHTRAKGSVSVGTVTSGYLVRSAEVPLEGKHHVVLQKVAGRHTRFTTEEMRGLLLCAAERVAKKHPGHKLQLGNLSRMGGGPLPWSVSHHNGRDADIGFYVKDSRGKPAVADHLYLFGRRLEATNSPAPLRFDVPANWTLVEGLLTCPGGDRIQHLFIAGWLREPLLRHAKEQKVDKQLFARAAAILAQPHRALAHNDHLHLRIGCAADDEAEGCLDAARAPQIAVGRSPGVQARLPRLRHDLKAQEARTRADAVTLLALYRDDEALPGLKAALRDPSAEVRLAALEGLGAWQPAGLADAIAARLASEDDPRVMAKSLQTLVILGALEPVTQRFTDLRVLSPPSGPQSALAVPQVVVRKLAVELLAETGSLPVAREALPLLADADPAVREATRGVLARLVNRSTPDLMADAHLPAGTPLDPHAEVALWRAFLDGLPADTSRDAVALAGLQKAGLRLDGLDRAALPELVRALNLPPPYRDNAARWIERIVHYRPREGMGARAMPAVFWSTWLVQKRILSAATLAATSPAGGEATAQDAD